MSTTLQRIGLIKFNPFVLTQNMARTVLYKVNMVRGSLLTYAEQIQIRTWPWAVWSYRKIIDAVLYYIGAVLKHLRSNEPEFNQETRVKPKQ